MCKALFLPTDGLSLLEPLVISLLRCCTALTTSLGVLSCIALRIFCMLGCCARLTLLLARERTLSIDFSFLRVEYRSLLLISLRVKIRDLHYLWRAEAYRYRFSLARQVKRRAQTRIQFERALITARRCFTRLQRAIIGFEKLRARLVARRQKAQAHEVLRRVGQFSVRLRRDELLQRGHRQVKNLQIFLCENFVYLDEPRFAAFSASRAQIL